MRFVPELLAFPYPIGFDTLHYAVAMKNGVVWAHWTSFFTSTWLLYSILVPLYQAFGFDPLMTLKVLGPALYGLNVVGIYFFARKMLGWTATVSVFAGVFFRFSLLL